MAREIFVLSAGAAKAVVLALKLNFEAASQVGLRTTFGAVGAIRDQWANGVACDVLILSAKLVDGLIDEAKIDATTRVSLGRVRTGIAVRTGAPVPAIANASELSQAFLAATALYLPDPERATAGIHCVAVLRRLDILAAVQPRLRAYPNGAIAMGELAASGDPRSIGCTQVTEILYTEGVVLAGTLPAGFELNTEYVAAVVADAREPDLARRFVRQLGSEATLAARRAGGFEVR
jgi:molybdate transport system substrate-binding protein